MLFFPVDINDGHFVMGSHAMFDSIDEAFGVLRSGNHWEIEQLPFKDRRSGMHLSIVLVLEGPPQVEAVVLFDGAPHLTWDTGDLLT